jgi:uncharacterized heparinase superfamily protein
MNIARFLRSVLPTPRSQLVSRLALLVKRHFLVAISPWWTPLASPLGRVDALQRSIEQPLPLWMPSSESAVVQGMNGWHFSFLNVTREFNALVDWHRDDLNSGTRLWKLHLHYFDWCAEISNTQLQMLIDDWILHNRPYHQGYWLDSWNSYAISIRLVSWMGELTRRGTDLDATFRERVENSIVEQLRFLLANLERDIGGNHLVKNIKALYWGARYFDGPEASRWGQVAERLLEQDINTQVLQDGFHFELSPAYHNQVFADLLDCWRLMHKNQLRDRLGHVLELMAQVVVDMTHPDGATSLFNDGGLNMTHSPVELMKAYADLFGLSPSARRDANFAAAGYYIYRDQTFFLVYDAGDVGPDGLPAHAHGDIFAFELSVGMQRVIVDCGVFEYNSGKRRSISRSTAAHNTLTLDGADQCEFWSAFRMGRRARVKVREVSRAERSMKIDAEHDGYKYLRGHPLHRRRLECSPGFVSVQDSIYGGFGQLATARLLLHPDVQIVSNCQGVLVMSVGSCRFRLDVTQGCISVHPAFWWPDFGKEEATLQIEIDYGCAPGSWSYRLQAIDSDILK